MPPPGITTRSVPASSPIVMPLGTDYAVEQRYPSSYSARESDHGNAIYAHGDAAAPGVPTVLTPAAAIYAIPACRVHMPDIADESRTPLGTARGVSEEIRGDLGEFSAIGEPSAMPDHHDLVAPPPPATRPPATLRAPLMPPSQHPSVPSPFPSHHLTCVPSPSHCLSCA